MKTKIIKFKAVHSAGSIYNDCGACVLSRLCIFSSWRCDLDKGWHYEYMEEVNK